MNQSLIDYIKNSRQQGINENEIREALEKVGWNEEQINEAFKNLDTSAPAPTIETNAGSTEIGLPSASNLLKQAFQIYKTKFKTLLGITLTPILGWVPVVLVILIFVGVRAFANANPGFATAATVINIIVGLGGIAAVVFAIYVYIWSQVAIIVAIRDREEGINWKESFSRSRPMIGKFVWIVFLTGLIIMGGYLLLVIPGIIFAIWFSFAGYVLVAEGDRGMQALVKSKLYVKGYWWSVLWRGIFLGIIIILIAVVPGIALEWIAEGAGGIFSNVVSIILGPLVAVYTFSLYENLRRIKGSVKTEGAKKKIFVAIGIIGLLVIPIIVVVVVLTSLKSAREQSLEYLEEGQIKQIQVGLELYWNENGTYPSRLSSLENTEYFDEVPTENDGTPFQYRSLEEGQNYELCRIDRGGMRDCVTSQDQYSF